MSPRQVVDHLTHDQRRVLRQLESHRGTIAGDRARELRITREVVVQLVELEAVQVDDTTGDLELTPAGLDLLQTMDQDAA